MVVTSPALERRKIVPLGCGVSPEATGNVYSSTKTPPAPTASPPSNSAANCCIQVGSSLERQANCGHTLRAITCLMGLTGNIEAPGSMVSWVLPDTGLIEDFNLELPITDEMKSKIIGGDRFKMGATRTCNPDTMVKKLLAGEAPIKVWFSVGGQQIVHMANTNEVVKAIEQVEFIPAEDGAVRESPLERSIRQLGEHGAGVLLRPGRGRRNGRLRPAPRSR